MPSILMWSPRPAGCVCVEGACGVAGARDQRVRARLPVLARLATLAGRFATLVGRIAASPGLLNSLITDHLRQGSLIRDCE